VKLLALLALVLFAAQFIIPASQRPLPRRPHVLVIHADQYRFDCVGTVGNPDVKTPSLDSLARDGVLFRNSFCTWPVCTPSRYSLLSGQYVRQHRGRSNVATLLPGTATFANLLRAAGYRTNAVGKMHFMPAYLDVGFTELQLAEQNGRGRLVDDHHRYLKERGLIDSVDLIDQEQPYRSQAPESYWKSFGAGMSNLPEEHHSTTWIGNRSVEVISRWTPEEPALLMVGFIKPHHPFDPPAPWDAMYDPSKLRVLPGWIEEPLERDLRRPGYFDNRTLTLPALRRVMAHYYATISQLDAQVGRMIDLLKRKAIYDDTLIIFTSDHGEYLGFHHLLLKGNLMYDPLVKVPLIIKFPHSKYARKMSGALVSSTDVTSTILRESGVEAAPDMRGHSLQSICAGEEAGRDLIFAEDGGYVMVRSLTRKFLYSSEPGRSLFFDLEKDPLEMHDLAGDSRYNAELQNMKDALLRWFQVDAQTSPYLDLQARQIRQPNVPPDRITAERQMEEYIRLQMRAVLKSGK
jgi:arylsulfatase A-like enzyme